MSIPRPVRHLALGGLGVAIAVGVLTLRTSPQAGPQTARPAAAPPAAVDTRLLDAVARLQLRLDAGEARLAFDARHGYLRSVLDHLEIPLSSQALVFSKSSAQMSGISPERPRALYFNDDAYVGWVQEGGLELAAVDPDEGPFFYTLPQIEVESPRFERHTESCVGCHDSSEDPTRLIPRLLKLSVLPDREGRSIQSEALVTTDRSPFRERWGGWYVTGTHGRQAHMGNQTFPPPPFEIDGLAGLVRELELSRGANVTDLRPYFDTARYPTPHSDIVALMVLGHQTHVQNLIAAANYRLGTALETDPGAATPELVRELAEPIVRTMLFSDEVALTDPVGGTSGFADEFQKRGPRDGRGRSLRTLDLRTRLFRYPMSFLIYSAEFDELRPVLRDYVYRRLVEVLRGGDAAPAFAHLTPGDRQAIVEILTETKPDFARLCEGCGSAVTSAPR